MPGQEIQLFKGTPVWQLAIAVYEQDTDKIKLIAVKDTGQLNFQEPKLKFTLLHWAIFNERYFSAKALLMAGANPNSVSADGDTPFILAASYRETSEYLRLILPYVGNVNAEIPGETRWHTPLEAAARNRLESVKLLIEKGADVNHVSQSKSTALYAACLNDIVIIHYLVIEQGADTKRPILVFNDGTRFFAYDFIKDMSFPKGSKEYKMKMEVIEQIKNNENNK
jgi:ankyrin repeat protein